MTQITEDTFEQVLHLFKESPEIDLREASFIDPSGMVAILELGELLKSLNVHINFTEFSPIPNTKMWDEMVENRIINKDIDLLLTNNSVYYYLYSEYDLKELERLKLDVKFYNAL